MLKNDYTVTILYLLHDRTRSKHLSEIMPILLNGLMASPSSTSQRSLACSFHVDAVPVSQEEGPFPLPGLHRNSLSVFLNERGWNRVRQMRKVVVVVKRRRRSPEHQSLLANGRELSAAIGRRKNGWIGPKPDKARWWRCPSTTAETVEESEGTLHHFWPTMGR